MKTPKKTVPAFFAPELIAEQKSDWNELVAEQAEERKELAAQQAKERNAAKRERFFETNLGNVSLSGIPFVYAVKHLHEAKENQTEVDFKKAALKTTERKLAAWGVLAMTSVIAWLASPFFVDGSLVRKLRFSTPFIMTYAVSLFMWLTKLPRKQSEIEGSLKKSERVLSAHQKETSTIKSDAKKTLAEKKEESLAVLPADERWWRDYANKKIIRTAPHLTAEQKALHDRMLRATIVQTKKPVLTAEASKARVDALAAQVEEAEENLFKKVVFINEVVLRANPTVFEEDVRRFAFEMADTFWTARFAPSRCTSKTDPKVLRSYARYVKTLSKQLGNG